MNAHRPSFLALFAILALPSCGRGGGDHPSPSATASAGPSPAGTTSGAVVAASVSGTPATPTARASAVPDEPPPGAITPSTFAGAKSEKACRAQTFDVASYQTRGEIALAGQGDTLAAAWRLRLGGKPGEQIAFASFDKDGRPLARPRGVGVTTHDVPPRVLPSGSGFAVVWFDDKGLAFARPRTEPLPPPEIAHVGAVGSDVADDVALELWPSGGGLAAAPFGADRQQLGLFVFAPEEGPSVKAVGVTHHAKQPRRPAIAAGPTGTIVAWVEGDTLVASRFDAAGKEGAACTIAPASPTPRERLSLAITPTGAVAAWMEGTKIRTRGLDASACPASPIWTVAEGKWATLAALHETPILAWVADGGRLLAVRLGGSGAAPARGVEVSEGSSGVKDAPALVTFGDRAAFGWAEAMSPVIATKRLAVRLVDATCIP